MVGASSWATRLAQQIIRGSRIRILTYSLPDIWYIRNMFLRHGRTAGVEIIAHAQFAERAMRLKRQVPGFRFATVDGRPREGGFSRAGHRHRGQRQLRLVWLVRGQRRAALSAGA